MSELNLDCLVENVPSELKKRKRWTTWGVNPKSLKMPDPPVNSEGLTFEAAVKRGHGVGIFLGDGLCGIDLDGCRNPETGDVDEWALDIVKAFGSYTEVSPSMTGLKIFCLGKPELTRKQKMIEDAEGYGGKKAAIEAYSDGRYFTITGAVYGKVTKVAAIGDDIWKRLNKFLGASAPGKTGRGNSKKVDAKAFKSGGRNNSFFRMATNMRKSGMEFEAALAAMHSANDTSTDEPCSDSELEKICRNAFKSHPDIPWIFAKNLDILPCQENVILALELLGVELRYDEFRDRKMNGNVVVDDFILNGLWLEIEKRWRFRCAKDYFWSVCDWLAHENKFHPVQILLGGLKWDGKKRISNWLAHYGGAESKYPEYLSWISKAVLVAAVNRIFEPGCVFQEMVVLQGEQGCGKSLALKTLCLDDEWFSDDLPLGSDSKIVVERTVGKWIIEAAELVETRGNKLEALKAFMSRSSERARLAWGREPVDRHRHFILMGTTNDAEFLRDVTGDRRFWPVTVNKFDLVALRKDREQLWAEAVVEYKKKFRIRMPEEMYPWATAIQDEHKVVSDWGEALDEMFEGKQGWFMASDLREWYQGQKFHDYISYQSMTKYLTFKLGFKKEFRKVNGSGWRTWWRGNRTTKIDIYAKQVM